MTNMLAYGSMSGETYGPDTVAQVNSQGLGAAVSTADANPTLGDGTLIVDMTYVLIDLA